MLSRLRRLSRLALVLAPLVPAAVAAGCGLSGSAPAISTVWPATIVPGQTRTVLIAGQGFKDGATATLGGQITLPGTVWINDRYMAAPVPAGIGGAGSQYSVVVTNPDGQQAVSPQPIAVGAAPAPATATPVATKTPPPTATREPPATQVRTPLPTPTPTPSPTVPAGPPIIIPPPQPPATTEIASPTPSATPAIAPPQSSPPPSPRGQRGGSLDPSSPSLPLQPGPPSRRGLR